MTSQEELAMKDGAQRWKMTPNVEKSATSDIHHEAIASSRMPLKREKPRARWGVCLPVAEQLPYTRQLNQSKANGRAAPTH